MEWIVALFMAVFGSVYFFWKKSGSKKPLIFKALATLMPALFTLFAAVQTKESVLWWGFAGIVCYMFADVLLEIWFLTGVACFGVGHIFLVMAILQKCRVSGNAVIYFLVLYLLMLLVNRPYVKKLERLAVPGFLYAALLCLMSSIAVAGGLDIGGVEGSALAAGGICFVVSDTILSWIYLSGKKNTRYSAVLLVLYYFAVFCLAVGMVG